MKDKINRLKCFIGMHDWEEKDLGETYFYYYQCRRCGTNKGWIDAHNFKREIEDKIQQNRIIDKLENFLDTQK